LRIDDLATKALPELIRVRTLREAEHTHVDVGAAEGVAAWAEREEQEFAQ